jgi:hypothetical protein
MNFIESYNDYQNTLSHMPFVKKYKHITYNTLEIIVLIKLIHRFYYGT